MEAKTALTPLTSAVGDKSEVSSGGSWHHQRYLPSKVFENPGPPKNNLMVSFSKAQGNHLIYKTLFLMHGRSRSRQNLVPKVHFEWPASITETVSETWNMQTLSVQLFKETIENTNLYVKTHINI